MSGQVFAFECSIVGTDWTQIVNARTPGQAKVEYWRDVHDAWPSIPYTAARVRKLGPPRSTERLCHCAEYRGVVFRAGDRVRVGDAEGVIVDGASGANFTVLFDAESRYLGSRMPVHPSSITAIAKAEGR
jgi:hypothetical protein